MCVQSDINASVKSEYQENYLNIFQCISQKQKLTHLLTDYLMHFVGSYTSLKFITNFFDPFSAKLVRL